jgi:hypothetical protein
MDYIITVFCNHHNMPQTASKSAKYFVDIMLAETVHYLHAFMLIHQSLPGIRQTL